MVRGGGPWLRLWVGAALCTSALVGLGSSVAGDLARETDLAPSATPEVLGIATTAPPHPGPVVDPEPDEITPPVLALPTAPSGLIPPETTVFVPTSAAPAEPEPAPPTTAHEAAGLAALATIGYPWESALPGWSIEFLPGRSGFLGSTWPERRVVEIYVRGDDTQLELAHVLAHEMAHALDVTYFDELDHARWREARGFDPEVPWYAPPGATDYGSPSGDLAEVFAVWQTGPDIYRGTAAPPPTLDQLELIAQLTDV